MCLWHLLWGCITVKSLSCLQSVKQLLIFFFWRRMAGTHRRLCGVCEATHWDQKYSGLTAAARGGFRNINVCTKPHRTTVGSREEDCTELRSTLPFQPSGPRRFTKRHFKIYNLYKEGVSPRLWTGRGWFGGFYFKSRSFFLWAQTNWKEATILEWCRSSPASRL